MAQDTSKEKPLSVQEILFGYNEAARKNHAANFLPAQQDGAPVPDDKFKSMYGF